MEKGYGEICLFRRGLDGRSSSPRHADCRNPSSLARYSGRPGLSCLATHSPAAIRSRWALPLVLMGGRIDFPMTDKHHRSFLPSFSAHHNDDPSIRMGLGLLEACPASASQAVHQHQHWIPSPAQTHLIRHRYETHSGLAAVSHPSSLELSWGLPCPSSRPWSRPAPLPSHLAPHDSRRPSTLAGHARLAHWRRSNVHSDESATRRGSRRRPRAHADRVRLCG